MKIVAVASSPLDATSLLVQATKVASANPDVIFAQVSSSALGAALLRALFQIGSTTQVIAAPGLTTQAFVEAAANAADGMVAAGGVGWDKPTLTQAEFIEGYGRPKISVRQLPVRPSWPLKPPSRTSKAKLLAKSCARL